MWWCLTDIVSCKCVFLSNCNTRVLIVLLTNLGILISALFSNKHKSCDRNVGERNIFTIQQAFGEIFLVDSAL